jgi:hypothetical protein
MHKHITTVRSGTHVIILRLQLFTVIILCEPPKASDLFITQQPQSPISALLPSPSLPPKPRDLLIAPSPALPLAPSKLQPPDPLIAPSPLSTNPIWRLPATPSDRPISVLPPAPSPPPKRPDQRFIAKPFPPSNSIRLQRYTLQNSWLFIEDPSRKKETTFSLASFSCVLFNEREASFSSDLGLQWHPMAGCHVSHLTMKGSPQVFYIPRHIARKFVQLVHCMASLMCLKIDTTTPLFHRNVTHNTISNILLIITHVESVTLDAFKILPTLWKWFKYLQSVTQLIHNKELVVLKWHKALGISNVWLTITFSVTEFLRHSELAM